MSIATTLSDDRRLITIDSFDDDGLSSGLRKIQIYLPADYHTSESRYPVLYFSDGGAVFSRNRPDMLEVDKVLDSMVEEGTARPTILVAIFNSSVEGRVKDLSPFVDSGYRGHAVGVGGVGGGLDGFYRMIAEHLKPYVDAELRTLPEPASTGIVGVSLGGLAAFTLAYDHPETFGMAGCMSSSFWSAGEATIKRVAADADKPKTEVRFWLDGGGGEYNVWREARSMHDLLERRGWTPGDDLAAYFDYAAAHDWPAFKGRIPNVLQFLLRKSPTCLIGHRLVAAVEPEAHHMNLALRKRTLVGVEALYENGMRLNIPSPDLTIDDVNVAVVSPADPIVLHGPGPGDTVLRSSYGGFEASLRITGRDDRFGADPNLHIGMHTDTDPHVQEIAAQGINATFLVRHDDDFVTVEVTVVDDNVQAVAEKLPMEQSCVQILLDGGLEDELRKGSGYDFWDLDRSLLINMSPSESGVPVSMESLGLRFAPGTPDWDRVMPARATVTCTLEPGGYRAILKVPAEYLDQQQGGSWEVVRVNVGVVWVDQSGEVKMADWQPDWLSFHSPIATGIFRRKTH